MSSHRMLICAIVPGFCAFALALTAQAEDYKVALDRPQSVGQTYTIHATGESSQEMTVDVPGAGPQKQSDAYKAELEGTIKVLAIDEHTKEPTKIECTVDKLMKDGKSALDAGTVVTGENKTGQATFTVNGNPVDAAVAPVLDFLLSVHKPGSPSDDEVFGTDKPEPVGATWPINTATAAADMAKSGLPIAKENLHGDAKLVGVKEVNGKQALEIGADMTAENLSGQMPNGAKIESGDVKAHFTGLFPTDPAQQALEKGQSMDIHMKASAAGPDGKAIAIQMSMTRSMTAHFGETNK